MLADLKLALRSKAELGVQLLFYLIVVTLFPLAVGVEPTMLRALGPGVLWVAALLASLLAADLTELGLFSAESLLMFVIDLPGSSFKI